MAERFEFLAITPECAAIKRKLKPLFRRGKVLVYCDINHAANLYYLELAYRGERSRILLDLSALNDEKYLAFIADEIATHLARSYFQTTSKE